MSEITFTYNGNLTQIQCNKHEKIKDIFNRYLYKIQKDKNSIYFIYSGNNNINEELTFEQLANQDDKMRNKMNIIVFDNSTLLNRNTNVLFQKSKEIICPICYDNSKLCVEDYNLFLYGCKYNHKIDNILINEFEKTQYIDMSKILCEICQVKNKGKTYNNMFYRCNTCKINICPLCKSNHNKTHNIIDYDNKNYICERHNEIYSLYCNNCAVNLCMYCENEHIYHNISSFGKIMPNFEMLSIFMKKFKEIIDKYKNDIKKIINMLNKTVENIDIYYNILNEIINNYDLKKNNYQILYNLESIYHIYHIDFFDNLNDIINDKNFKNKFKKIYDIYEKMLAQYINKLKIKYKINRDENEIKLFGSQFVNNNMKNCKILIDNKEYNLMECFNIENISKQRNELEITLLGIKNITDMSYMFSECTSFISSSDISKMNTRNVINMSHMFDNCYLLNSLPDISKWNTKNVTNMSYMFYCCELLKTLPNISQWNVYNVTDMSYMFYGCELLQELPDISQWKTHKVSNMRGMFENCSSLSSLPDISKWNTYNVVDMNSMFSNCSSLSSFPNIEKWSISQLKDRENMFEGCNKSLNIPSKFKTIFQMIFN